MEILSLTDSCVESEWPSQLIGHGTAGFGLI